MISRNLFRVPGTFSNSQRRLKKPPSSVACGPDRSIALIFVARKRVVIALLIVIADSYCM
jgi:hypothetical protein